MITTDARKPWPFTCIECEHPLIGTTPDARMFAWLDHQEYVHATKDKTEDPHFELHRLEALVAL